MHKFRLGLLLFFLIFNQYIFSQDNSETICGTDDRVPSNYKAVGRIIFTGGTPPATGFIIADGRIITAGHVHRYLQQGDWIEFNVKPSLSNGEIQYSNEIDRYFIDVNSCEYQDEGDGHDWMVFSVFPNSTSGIKPYEAQDDYFLLKKSYGSTNNNYRLIGYGADENSSNHIQQTSVGDFIGYSGYFIKYNTDSENGNSGGPIIEESTGYVIGVHTTGRCSSYGYNGGTTFTLDAFWTALNLGNIVTVDQTYEDGTRIPGSFVSYYDLKKLIPSFVPREILLNEGVKLQFPLNSQQAFLAASELFSSPIEKFYTWNQDGKILNLSTFVLNNSQTTFISQLKKTYENIIIKNEFPELNGIYVSNSIIKFKDPWLIDYPDPQYNYQKRNQGVSAPFKQQFSPFTVDYTTNYNGDVYQGVFLEQEIILNRPFYSVLSPTQDITLPQTGRTHKFYFQNWTGSGVSFQDASALSTGVVFTSTNAVVTATLKGTQLSGDINAYKSNSQRKFYRLGNASGEILFHVYECMGTVWCERSENYGTSWTIVNDGKPLANNSSSKSPSIEYRDPYNVAVIYQEKNEQENSTITIANISNYGTVDYINVNDNIGIPGYEATKNAQPVISVAETSESAGVLVAWIQPETFGSPAGIYYKYGIRTANGISWQIQDEYGNDYKKVEGTDANSAYPTIAIKRGTLNSQPSFHFAWSQNETSIQYCRLTADANNYITQSSPQQGSTYKNLSTYSGYTKNYMPSLAILQDDLARIAWIGERNESGGGDINKITIAPPTKKTVFRGINNDYNFWYFVLM